MQFEIYTYGILDGLFYTLNALAMIVNSDFIDSIIKLVAFSVTGYYSVKIMATLSGADRSRLFMRNIGMLMMVNILLIPKADMLLVDRITKQREKIDNLPYGFVVPVGLFEAVGAGMAGTFEQAFAPVSSTNFGDYGMIFGSRLVQEARSWKIANPEFVSNLDRFTKRCIVVEAGIGYNFTKEDVVATDDIFGLVSSRAGVFRLVDFNVGGEYKRLSCKDAAAQLQTYWGDEYGNLSKLYKNHDFGLAGKVLGPTLDSGALPDLNRVLADNIELSYKDRLGTAIDAKQIVRQTMMINALKDSARKRDRYGYSRAANLQDSNWRIAGDLAAEYVPLFLNVFKSLIYSTFIFMIPLMIISGGWSKYASWMQVVASLQLWPALNSVLNLFVELYSVQHGVDSLSFVNFNKMHNSADKIVAIASGMQALIPYLSYIIVQGGVGGFVHAAQMLNSTTAGATGTAASEVSSGNRAFNTRSYDTLQEATQNGFKIDRNQSYASGASREQLYDGMIENATASGHVFHQSGQGVNIAQTANKLDLASEERSSNTTALASEEQHLKELRSQFAENNSHQMQNMQSWVKNIAKRMDNGADYDFKQLGSIGNDVEKAVNHERALSDRFEYNKQQDGTMRVGADISADTGKLMGAVAGKGVALFSKIPGMQTAGQIAGNKLSAMPGMGKIGNVVKDAAGLVPGVDVKANLSAQYSATDLTVQGLTDATSDSKTDGSKVNWNNVKEAALNQTFTEHVGTDKNLSSDIRSTADQGKALTRDISMSEQRIDSLSQRREYLQSAGASFNIEGTSHVIDNLVGQGMNVRDAHNLVENPHKATGNQLSMLNSAKKQVTDNLLGATSNIGSNANVASNWHAQKDKHQTEMQNFHKEKTAEVIGNVLQGHNDVNSKANFGGVSANEIESQIKQQQAKLQGLYKEYQNRTGDQIKTTSEENQKRFAGKEGEIDKAENKDLRLFGRDKPKNRS